MTDDRTVESFGRPISKVRRNLITWRDVGPCPCGYRPPNIDSIEGWTAWYDHLSEVHGD